METEQTQMDLSLKDLNQYSGSAQYHKINFFGIDFNLTDGLKYIMTNGYSWFVTDFLSVEICKKLSKKEGFICIKLKLDGNKGLMLVTDGNENTLYKQKYKYTTAKREITLFFIDGVLMLSGEY